MWPFPINFQVIITIQENWPLRNFFCLLPKKIEFSNPRRNHLHNQCEKRKLIECQITSEFRRTLPGIGINHPFPKIWRIRRGPNKRPVGPNLILGTQFPALRLPVIFISKNKQLLTCTFRPIWISLELRSLQPVLHLNLITGIYSKV